MIKKSIPLILIILLIAVLFSCRTSVSATDESSLYSNIDQYLHGEVAAAHIPGMSVLIVDKEKVLFSNTYGNCNSIDAPFIIGSNSKSFTAASIMQLVEQNKINLDDPIDRYLSDTIEGDKITVRQLLNHTSGIQTYDTQADYKISSNQGSYVYANANYGLLGQIIESVSGLSYNEYVKTHIFEPLDMNHSFTSLDEAKENGLITGYRNYFGFMIPEEISYPDLDSRGWLSIPAGYIISSASDMGKYLQLYLNDGCGILQPESIQTMFYDSVRVADDRLYGFGWGVLKNYPEPVISHGGLVENYITHMFILPESGVAGVLLINYNDYLVANDMTGTMLNGVLMLLFGQEPSYIKESSYIRNHFILDVLYLFMICLCVLPLLLLKKWMNRLYAAKRVKRIIGFTLLHLILPSLLLAIPRIAETPLSVVKSFVPDLFIVIIGGSIIAYGTGFVKLIYIFLHFKGFKDKRHINSPREE